jgi:hypothetical protein
MPDVEKNDPETEKVWYAAFDLGLVGSETPCTIHRDEKGIIRIVRRIERSPAVEYVDEEEK